MELWDGESFDTITAHMGNLLKIDDLTISLSRSKFARVCIELDLSKPLCRGFRVGDDIHKVFIMVVYERLPTFCYTCGVIGHGSKFCYHAVTSGDDGHSPPLHESRRPAVNPSQTKDVAAMGMAIDSVPADP